MATAQPTSTHGTGRIALSFCTIAFQGKKWGAGRTIDMPIERILPVLASAGYDAVEIWEPHVADHTAGQLLGLARQLADLGLRAACVSPYFDFTTSPETAADSVSRGKRVIEIAAALGAGAVRAFTGKTGSDTATPEQWQRATESLRALGDSALPHGICLVLETHKWNLMDTVASSRRLVGDTGHPAVRLNLQPSTFGTDYLRATRELMPMARHIHATNSRDGAGCGLREGTMDWRVILAEAVAQGFTGAVSVEWFGADPAQAAPREAAHLRELLASVLAASGTRAYDAPSFPD